MKTAHLPRLPWSLNAKINRTTFYVPRPGRTRRAQQKMVTVRYADSLTHQQRRLLVELCDSEGRRLSLHCRDLGKLRRMMGRDPQFAARVTLITPLSYTPHQAA